MTLEQLFATAESHNASMKAAQMAVDEAALGVDAARAVRLPDLEATASVSYLGNVAIWDRPLKNKFTATTPHFGNNFAVMARQVVYSGGAINSGIRLAELGKAMAETEAEENRQRVRFLLAGHYLQLHNLRNRQEVFDKNIALAETLIQQTRRRAEQGIALSNDITRHELQVEQLKLGRARVEDARHIINHQLTTALGVDSAVAILPQDDFSTALCPQDGEGAWQQMANAHGAAFWSIYHAMGGYNSMAAWVDQGLGGPDYIHFSQRGVDIMGDRLSKAFDNMYHIYKMRKEVEDVQ